MIELRNLTKVFTTNGRRKPVFENLNLIVPEGTSVGLLGRNGAGKSTLLQILAGTLEPTSGEVITDASISWPVGFAGSFHPDLTGAQNTRFLARIYGVDSSEMSRFVEDFAELGSHFHMPIRTYSSGMRGRLAFGASMAIKFDYYLVDEATATGDQSFRAKADATFQNRMRDAGSFVVSHSMGQIRSLCDVGLVLENGQIHLFDDIEEAIAHHEENLGTAPSRTRVRAAGGGANPLAALPQILQASGPDALSDTAPVKARFDKSDSRNRELPNGQYVRLTGSLEMLRQSQQKGTGKASEAGAVLLCLHGGGGQKGRPERMDTICAQIHKAGENRVMTAAASYRLHDRDQANLYDMIKDAEGALDWAVRLAQDWAPEGTRLYVLGESFGALLALEAMRLSSRNRAQAVDGLILLNPVVDIGPEGFSNAVVPQGAYEDINPMLQYGKPTAQRHMSCLLMHGGKDDIVPISAARDFAALWPEGQSHLIELPNAGHGFCNRMPAAERTGRAIAEFLAHDALAHEQSPDN